MLLHLDWYRHALEKVSDADQPELFWFICWVRTSPSLIPLSEFGHGVRTFSIKAAYMETPMSRVYGGIHFLDGALEGTKQGELVGDWVWAKLRGKDAETAPTKEIQQSMAGKHPT